MTRNTINFEWGPEQEEAPQQVQVALQVALPLGLCECWGHIGMLSGAFGRPWSNYNTGPLNFGEDPCYPLQITTLLLRNSFGPATGLTESECFNMGHQVTMGPKLPTMNWVLPDPPNYDTGSTQQHSIIKWKWYTHGWAQAGPMAQVSYMKKWPQCP